MRSNHTNNIFINKLLIVLGDLLVITFSYFLVYFVRFHWTMFTHVFPPTKGIPPFEDFLRASPIVLCMWFVALFWQGCYRRIQIPALDELIRIFQSAVIGTLLSMAAMFFNRESSYSRLVFVLSGCAGFVAVYAFRQTVKVGYLTWVGKKRRMRRVLVVGEGYLAKSIKKVLERYRDRAVLTIDKWDLEAIKKTIKRSKIREVLLSQSKPNHTDIVPLADFCEDVDVRLRILPDLLEIRMGEVVVDDFLSVPTIHLKPVSLHGASFLTKRIVDVTIASLALGLLFGPLALISLLIKLTSKGPVFYAHKRMGYRQRPFDFMKFRTMVSDADALLEDLKAKNDRVGPAFKIKNDPRITAFGRFLRRYSLDELPQLINVLRGEMSIVGPRPQVLWEAAAYDNWAKKRLNVLPGITGLWQTSGRADLTYQEMIDLDIYYIEHWSLGLDLKIILKTFPVILFADGAY